MDRVEVKMDVPNDGLHMPRERALAEGVFALGDAEILALLLGTGARGRTVLELANQLLREFDGLDGIASAGPFALADRTGMGLVKALRLLGGVELGRRYVYRAGRRREPVASSAAVFARFGPVLGGREDEEMWVMSVDARNLVRGCRKVALGGVHVCGMHPRNILRTALLEGAAGMVVVHNHPSGNPAPSMDDILMTKRMLAAADVAGITLVDHLIIGSNEDYRSMLDLGFLPERAPADTPLLQRPYGTRIQPLPGDP